MKLLTRPRKIAIGVGAGLGIAGVAFAAVLLSADITGSTAVNDVNSSLVVQSARVTESNNGISCSANTNNSYSGFRIDASARRVNGNVAEQSCTFTIRVYNSGVVPATDAKIDINGAQGSLNGWTVTPKIDGTIPAGAESVATVSMKAGGAGVTDVGRGSISGKLTANVE